MLFLDDFLEMLEELPVELRERCTELRQLDLQVQIGQERIRAATGAFFERAEGLSEDERQREYEELREEFNRVREKAAEKVAIAERMQEMVEKYVHYLEKEKTHFKYELEADNPGVTEAIEKRFRDYCESVIAMRKERKRERRIHHNNQNEEPPSKMSRSESLSAMSRQEFAILDEDMLSPMLQLSQPPSGFRSRKSTVGRTSASVGGGLDTMMADDTPPPSATRKRQSVSSARSAFSLQLERSGGGGGSHSQQQHAVSPSSDRSWTPSSSLAGDPPSMHSPSLLAPHSATHPLTHTPPVSAFAGAESRHGRHRKLTSRVQEMFKETLQRQEMRGRHHGHQQQMREAVQVREREREHLARTPVSGMGEESRDGETTRDSVVEEGDEEVRAVVGGGVAGAGLEDGGDDTPLIEEEEESGDELGEGRRTWCICNQKSYGDMVACDNKTCPFEWFHYHCVAMTAPPRGKWFCPHCVEQMRRREEADGGPTSTSLQALLAAPAVVGSVGL